MLLPSVASAVTTVDAVLKARKVVRPKGAMALSRNGDWFQSDKLTGSCWMLFDARYKEAERSKIVGGLEE
jgi:hypothetical protein